jgi:hypothetical protein
MLGYSILTWNCEPQHRRAKFCASKTMRSCNRGDENPRTAVEVLLTPEPLGEPEQAFSHTPMNALGAKGG